MVSGARRHTTPRRTDTSDPSRSRERALRVLFQADLRGVAPTVTLHRLDGDPDARSLLDARDELTEEVPIVPLPTVAAPSPIDPGGAPPRDRRSAPESRVGQDRRGSRSSPGAEAAPGGQAAPGGEAAPGSQAAPVSTAAHLTRARPSSSAGPGPDEPIGAGRSSGWTDPPEREGPADIDGFTRSLVRGVEDHRTAVEALITRYSRRWAIPRMPVVDRNILRLATYELLHERTPPAVVIDEAVSLAKRLSTEDSGRFVNGVLESIRREIVATRGGTDDAEA